MLWDKCAMLLCLCSPLSDATCVNSSDGHRLSTGRRDPASSRGKFYKNNEPSFMRMREGKLMLWDKCAMLLCLCSPGPLSDTTCVNSFDGHRLFTGRRVHYQNEGNPMKTTSPNLCK
jgi:hypothetical protein